MTIRAITANATAITFPHHLFHSDSHNLCNLSFSGGSYVNSNPELILNSSYVNEIVFVMVDI